MCRTRTSLVSPDDLRAAAVLMAPLRLGVRMVSFPSGVIVVQSDQLSEQSICARVLSLLSTERAQTGIQATDVARLLKLPLQVSREQLLLAESRGVLCRDESAYGIAYYKNLFLD